MKKGIFYWFKDSAKMKRWMMLILVGVVFASFGMSSMIVATDTITFMQAGKIVVYFVIGFTCIVLGLIYLNKRTMELFIEATDERTSGNKKVNVNSLIFNKNIYDQGPNIVVIGGGSGLNTIVNGLKRYTSNITAIVTVSNYGENLTQNNDELRYLQLEDIKDGMAALALSENSKMKEVNMKVTYHDPCHLARGQGIKDQPREIIEQIPGVEFEEMLYPCQCCGAGGGIKSGRPEIAMELSKAKAEMIKDTNADAVITICPFCQRNIQDGLDDINEENVNVIHILELLEKSYE